MMIDSILIAVVSGVGMFALAVVGMASSSTAGIAAAVIMFWGLMIVGSVLYFAVLESSAHQATLGKLAVGLIVTDAQGQRISFGRAVGRKFSKVLSQMTFGIGYILAGFTDRKQALHDLVAGTLVVKKNPARNSVGVVIACVAAGSIPFVGIVAAIAVPGLLRARMAGNETTAIRTMRSITAAQLSYFSRCGAYAPDLASLSSERAILGPELLAHGSVALSGYTFSIKAANAATRVPDAPAGCEGAVSDYAAQATPVTPGSSGLRFFATDGSSTIYQWTENGVGAPKPIK
jgi:uncharacterized RDD family membrane protein YckC